MQKLLYKNSTFITYISVLVIQTYDIQLRTKKLIR
jgi:hypothetical protein